MIDAFWSHDFNFLNFPKTAAGPGASEKPCGCLGRLLGALGRAYSPLDRLLGLKALLKPPGALLGASWSLLGRPLAQDPLGRLLRHLEAMHNTT